MRPKKNNQPIGFDTNQSDLSDYNYLYSTNKSSYSSSASTRSKVDDISDNKMLVSKFGMFITFTNEGTIEFIRGTHTLSKTHDYEIPEVENTELDYGALDINVPEIAAVNMFKLLVNPYKVAIKKPDNLEEDEHEKFFDEICDLENAIRDYDINQHEKWVQENFYNRNKYLTKGFRPYFKELFTDDALAYFYKQGLIRPISSVQETLAYQAREDKNSSLRIGLKILAESKFTYKNLETLSKYFPETYAKYDCPEVIYNYLSCVILGSYALLNAGALFNKKGEIIFDQLYEFHKLDTLFAKIEPYYEHTFGLYFLQGLWHYLEGNDLMAMHYLRYSQYYYEHHRLGYDCLALFTPSELECKKPLDPINIIYPWAGTSFVRLMPLQQLSSVLLDECISNYSQGQRVNYADDVIKGYEDKVQPVIKNCISLYNALVRQYGQKKAIVSQDAIDTLLDALNEWCSLYAYGACFTLGHLAQDAFKGQAAKSCFDKPIDIYIKPISGSFDAYKYALPTRSILPILKLIAQKFAFIINLKLGHNFNCSFDPKDFEDNEVNLQKAAMPPAINHVLLVSNPTGKEFSYEKYECLFQIATTYFYETYLYKNPDSTNLSKVIDDPQLLRIMFDLFNNELMRYTCSDPNALIGYKGYLNELERVLLCTHLSAINVGYANAKRLNRCQNYLNGQRLIPTLDLEYLTTGLFLFDNVNSLAPFKLNCVHRSGLDLFYLAIHSELFTTWQGDLVNDLIVAPLKELLQDSKDKLNKTTLSKLRTKRHRLLSKYVDDELLSYLNERTIRLVQEHRPLWAFNNKDSEQDLKENLMANTNFGLGEINNNPNQAASIIGVSENSKDQLLCLDLLIFNYEDTLEIIKEWLQDVALDLKLDLAFLQTFYQGCPPTFLICKHDLGLMDDEFIKNLIKLDNEQVKDDASSKTRLSLRKKQAPVEDASPNLATLSQDSDTLSLGSDLAEGSELTQEAEQDLLKAKEKEAKTLKTRASSAKKAASGSDSKESLDSATKQSATKRTKKKSAKDTTTLADSFNDTEKLLATYGVSSSVPSKDSKAKMQAQLMDDDFFKNFDPNQLTNEDSDTEENKDSPVATNFDLASLLNSISLDDESKDKADKS